MNTGGTNAATRIIKLHLERFAVLANVFPGRAVLIPHKLPSLEVFCLRSTGHPGGSQDIEYPVFTWKINLIFKQDIEYPVLTWKINLIFKSSDGDLRAREGPKDLLHHSEMLPDVRMYFLSNIKKHFPSCTCCHEFGRG